MTDGFLPVLLAPLLLLSTHPVLKTSKDGQLVLDTVRGKRGLTEKSLYWRSLPVRSVMALSLQKGRTTVLPVSAGSGQQQAQLRSIRPSQERGSRAGVPASHHIGTEGPSEKSWALSFSTRS